MQGLTDWLSEMSYEPVVDPGYDSRRRGFAAASPALSPVRRELSWSPSTPLAASDEAGDEPRTRRVK